MGTLQKNIKDLIFFYVKTNYEKYLEDNNISTIPEDKLSDIVNTLYTQRKDHIQIFIIDSLKELLNREYPGDQTIKNILLNIFQDDDLCKNRLLVEIKMHQQKINKGKIDYKKLLK
jgi:hypothetical protein